MSRLTDLISQVKGRDPELGKELEREFKTLSSRLPFGLNFERHSPESVELPGRPVRKGDKVRILPPRGSTAKGDMRLWRVRRIERVDGRRVAHIELANGAEAETCEAAVEDLIVIVEFRDYIYPGLISTGKVTRGSNKPFHTVINAENFHALEALTFTHRGKIDAIYIDPPYNTGARDWKYNNDYVEGEDIYRHSKWLAMMERRLFVARELLNPEDSVLIVTIDEKEYLRLGLLLEQVFPEGRIQMVTSVISSQGSVRDGLFTRSDEYIYFVSIGKASAAKSEDDMLNEGQSATKGQLWFQFVRTGKGNLRVDSKNLFYPIFVNQESGRIESIGEPIPLHIEKELIEAPPNTVAIWPLTADGREARWRTGVEVARRRAKNGLLRMGKTSRKGSGWSAMTVNEGTEKRIASGEVIVEGYAENGAANLVEISGGSLRAPKTTWNRTSHNAGWHGSKLLATLLPGRQFPYPKSLFAVEDALRFFVKEKPKAVILDFFAGSGTTAHAVMRLNKQDGGRRQCISITNNEVAAEEVKKLRQQGLRPGDPDWEKWGICDYITKARIEAAITGKTPAGEPIKGDYKFTDEFPMAEGFEENAEFFTLTYETPVAVGHNHAFARIAPLLWIRAGSTGTRINQLPENGWSVVENYGLLTDLDQAGHFEKAIEASDTVIVVYIVTDDERRFQSIAQRLPKTVEPIRLYEAYLTNFRFAVGR